MNKRVFLYKFYKYSIRALLNGDNNALSELTETEQIRSVIMVKGLLRSLTDMLPHYSVELSRTLSKCLISVLTRMSEK